MRSFFKMFFASLLSLIIFSVLAFFILVGLAATLTKKSKPDIAGKSVLVIDLSKDYKEFAIESPLNAFSEETDIPSLYELTRLIRHAKTDNNISGIYLIADNNSNGAASNNEIRRALLDFKTAKKFIIAHGDVMSQSAYFVASAADKVYVNPTGIFEWYGYSVTLPFLKGTLEKLDIQPQIFYAGKFKSATEIFRTDKMTPENKLQTTVMVNNMYGYFLNSVAASRHLDTATLRQLANTAAIQTPSDALKAGLIDAVKYDDQVKTEVKDRLRIGKYDKLNLVSISKYNEAVDLVKTGSDRIAVIYAEGDIVDGEGTPQNIGGESFRAMIRKARLDKRVKAIVLRVNSGGGSALASEIMWRELQMAKLEDKKPVVVSFGDVAASGGYYISCGADSIFCNPNTITGSIGVFGIIPNMQNFFKSKLGVTFDGVTTSPYADMGVLKPLDERQKQIIQSSIERMYGQFKQRVADGRKKGVAYIDSIAQGRVWTGWDALQIGLVDRLGNLDDAIACAARMAKISDYGIKEYPETEGWLQTLLNKKKSEPEAIIKEKLGAEYYRTYQQVMKIKEMSNSVQARLPYEIIFN
ncbi:MAG: signal peptide peptidase SppA [Candidatus Dadabacteria bacterium]